MSNEANSEPLPSEHTFCCGGKNCPKIQKKDGGLVISEDGREVPFSKEQAVELALWLDQHGYRR